MKDFIEQLLNQESDFNSDQIINIFNAIGNAGDIILLKNDGLRKENKFTLVIISHNNSFDNIRVDGDNLSTTFKRALNEYVLNKL